MNNDELLGATNGGLYSVYNNDYSVDNDEIITFDISFLQSDENSNIWIGSKDFGILQILDSDYNLIASSDFHLRIL